MRRFRERLETLADLYRPVARMIAVLAVLGVPVLLVGLAQGLDAFRLVALPMAALGGLGLLLFCAMAAERGLPSSHRGFWLGVYTSGALATFLWLISDLPQRAARDGAWWYLVGPIGDAFAALLWPLWWLRRVMG